MQQGSKSCQGKSWLIWVGTGFCRAIYHRVSEANDKMRSASLPAVKPPPLPLEMVVCEKTHFIPAGFPTLLWQEQRWLMAPTQGVLYPWSDLVACAPSFWSPDSCLAHTDDQLSAAPKIKLPVSSSPTGSSCEDVLISRATCSLITFCLDSHQIKKLPSHAGSLFSLLMQQHVLQCREIHW